jgi:hypothetical protein
MQQNAVLIGKREGKCSMMSWGVYGPALHKGQTQLGNPLKALPCAGSLTFGYLLAALGGGIVLYYKPS